VILVDAGSNPVVHPKATLDKKITLVKVGDAVRVRLTYGTCVVQVDVKHLENKSEISARGFDSLNQHQIILDWRSGYLNTLSRCRHGFESRIEYQIRLVSSKVERMTDNHQTEERYLYQPPNNGHSAK
jgi:hypothetical protein